MRHALLLASVLATSVSGCATDASSASASTAANERELTAADSAAPVQVAPGQVLVVRVQANASTGYSWAWDEAVANGVVVRDGEPTMSGVDPQRVGSGGTQTWRFRAAAAGQGELRLDYRRPWEKDTAPAQTVRWRIEVR